MPKPKPSQEKKALVKRLARYHKRSKCSPATIALEISMRGTLVSYQQVYRWLRAAAANSNASAMAGGQFPEGDRATALAAYLSEKEVRR